MKVLIAEEGMTWLEWAQSEYTRGDFEFVCGYDVGTAAVLLCDKNKTSLSDGGDTTEYWEKINKNIKMDNGSLYYVKCGYWYSNWEAFDEEITNNGVFSTSYQRWNSVT